MKIALIATHPIQYQVPWYRALAQNESVTLTVYYAVLPDEKQQGVGFGVPFQWDVPLLDGYDWEVLSNTARAPGLDGFFSSSTPAIYDTLAETRPDVVIITGWHAWPMLQALAACMRLGIPRIVRGESNAMRRRPMWIRMIHRILLSRFDAFLAIGMSNRAFYVQNEIKPERIFSAPYFIDNRRLSEQAEQLLERRHMLRAEWNVPERSTCFLYAGKLEPKKRIFDLLAAFDRANEGRSDLHLLVVGAGELLDVARSRVEHRNLPVTFTGFLNQSEIAKAYVAGDCLVLPSDDGETWGLVVNEAMACGRPALVSDRVGCHPDLIEEGRTGSVFPFGDVEELAKLLVRFASEGVDLDRMGARAREKVASYSAEAAAVGTVNAVEAVLAARRRFA